jgi:putative toxin-antitoxin system antitoxin component (TIGR02293 family)
MSEAERIVELLGGQRALGTVPDSEAAFISLVRLGLPFPSFQQVTSALHLSLREIERILGLSTRSLQRRKAGRLTAAESERILRLVRTAARAERVLGDPAAALDWLGSPNRALGGESPLQLLDTDLGAKRVLDVLGRIEHGVYG